MSDQPTYSLPIDVLDIANICGKRQDSGLKMHDNVKRSRDEGKEGALVAWNVRPNDAHGQEHGRKI